MVRGLYEFLGGVNGRGRCTNGAVATALTSRGQGRALFSFYRLVTIREASLSGAGISLVLDGGFLVVLVRGFFQ